MPLTAGASGASGKSGGDRLGPERRVRLARDFARVRRVGRSVSGGFVSLGYARRDGEARDSGAQPADPARVGFIVGKRVGGAVLRNRVRRRLREVMRRRLRAVAPGWDLVVIARPAAARATSADLASELVTLLARAKVLAPDADAKPGAKPGAKLGAER